MHVGFLFNCSMNTNPMDRLSPAIINRVMLMDAALKRQGSRIFYYSPKHITSINKKVPGYLIDGREFIPTTSPVPLVNGNWTYSTRKLLDTGMGYRNLIDWSEANQVGIYVPLVFSELVANKYETYKLVRGYRNDIHPHTEMYQQSIQQLEFFMGQGNLVFLKPRAGNKGDGIVSLRKANDSFILKFYKNGSRKEVKKKELRSALDFIRQLTAGSKSYVIQQGIETLRHEGSVFDFRVIMLYDGGSWDWLHEVRYSPLGSDLSNVSQGGISLVTEQFLNDLLGYEAGNRVLDELRSEAFGLAQFLDRLHPGELMEIAFDFVLHKNGSLRLVEINTKPGLVNLGFVTNFFNMKPDQKLLFERWVYPHTNALARFFQSKIDSL